LERSQEEIESLTGKYPLGSVQFYDDAVDLNLKCRNELISRMVSTLNLVKGQEIEILVNLPKLPIKPFNVYPVLEYQYRVSTKSAVESA
jgi:hypothetical protein